jgi:hypothetical protein
MSSLASIIEIKMKSMSYAEGRPGTWRHFANLLISSPTIAQWAPVPLRLIVGYGFMEHGFSKAARGFDAFPAILSSRRFNPSLARAFLTGRWTYFAPGWTVALLWQAQCLHTRGN